MSDRPTSWAKRLTVLMLALLFAMWVLDEVLRFLATNWWLLLIVAVVVGGVTYGIVWWKSRRNQW